MNGGTSRASASRRRSAAQLLEESGVVLHRHPRGRPRHPFALSLSKPVLSPVEGGLLQPRQRQPLAALQERAAHRRNLERRVLPVVPLQQPPALQQPQHLAKLVPVVVLHDAVHAQLVVPRGEDALLPAAHQHPQHAPRRTAPPSAPPPTAPSARSPSRRTPRAPPTPGRRRSCRSPPCPTARRSTPAGSAAGTCAAARTAPSGRAWSARCAAHASSSIRLKKNSCRTLSPYEYSSTHSLGSPSRPARPVSW